MNHSPRKANPTPAEIDDAQAIAEILGGGAAYPTEDGGLILDPIGDPTDRRFPTHAEIARDETAAYREHGERAAEKGWRILTGHRNRAPQDGSGWELAVPDGTPVLLPNGTLAWSTGQVLGDRLLVTLGTILGPSTLAPGVRPCTEDNLPTRYAAALAVQLTDALDQIASNDDDDDVALRAIRMKRAAANIADGLVTGDY